MARPATARAWSTIDAATLDAMTFPAIRYIVPGLIPEGLTLLAGKPKFGKSYLALDIAVAVASGGVAFGGIDCAAGDVLYAALEDNPRRLQARLRSMLPYGAKPERLHIATDWRRVGRGCEDDLQQWLDEQANPRLIILDTLARIKPISDGRGSLYDEDHGAIRPLQEIAGERGIAILVIHHVRKSEADDIFDTISGSNGLMGVADTLMVLGRRGDLTLLSGKGRDLEDYEKALSRDVTGGWRITGDAADLASTRERQAVLDAVRGAAGPIGAREVSDLTGAPYENVRRTMARMNQAGELIRTARGQYSCPNSPIVPTNSETRRNPSVDDDDDWDSRFGPVPSGLDDWDIGTVGTGGLV